MRPLQMVDLKQQYEHIKKDVDQALHEVLDSCAFINGKPVQDFANSLAGYLGAKYVIPCANGTDALQIALMSLQLQPGDEVITPSFTYIATTEVIALLRLKPVFVDVDPKTFCLVPEEVEKAITAKTKAIIPVHLYGHAAPMEPLMRIAEKYGLFIVEDNAQAIGCDYTFSNGDKRKTGTIGTIGCTSFFPSKNLGCYGDGGALFTDDENLAGRLKMIANHGQKVRYYHEMVGCNSRLDTLQAAVLNIKLKKLDEYTAARQKAAACYTEAFSGLEQITTPYIAPYSDHVFHQYTLILNGVSRDGLHQYLAEQQIPSMIYYPVPVHRQQMFASFGGGDYRLPQTDWLTERVISLPIHTELETDQLEFITQHVLTYINK
ncbi:MAG: DegT/DnrJ/EryC1/StrS family aminotransferase [Chitinophagaceae bacterium]|nr:DegT/DnrJ/EryC1/StrS family aminotransferase [Chitinophagaceae bacterium]